jgi:putative ABC transport system ATP-binding protein
VPEQLAVENVCLAYGKGLAAVPVLRGITAAFPRGELTLLMGPSGSGKTSLLSVLGCILRPDSGEVRVLGESAARLREDERTHIRLRRIGFVFQSFRLFESLNALENVALSLRLAGTPRRERLQRASAVLSDLGLDGRLRRKPNELSGGEKQRVALARAIVHDPPIVLADEPTASLDTESGLKVAALLREIAERQRRIVVVVSHDTRLRAYAHRCLRILDGRILEENE